ncbi:5965_t:CDS:2, partial [Dentiscutata erythropus]
PFNMFRKKEMIAKDIKILKYFAIMKKCHSETLGLGPIPIK